MNDSYRIRKSLLFDDINWNSVEEMLEKRFRLSTSDIKKIRRSFANRFRLPILPRDFQSRQLKESSEKVIASICQIIGADVVELKRNKKISLLIGNVGLTQSITFFPNLSRAESGTSGFYRVKYILDLFGRKVKIDRIGRALAIYCAILLFSLSFYTALLYPIAVFVYFLSDPAQAIIEGTQNFSIGAALITSLVIVAAATGKLVRGLFPVSKKMAQHVHGK